MSFASMTATLRLNIADFSTKLNQAAKSISKFSKDMSVKYSVATKELHKHNLGLKDTARIVQGIMISQTFYAAVNAIRSATSALAQFNEQLDYAKVSFSALFGDTALAEDFVGVLQQHAVDTIFGYQDLSEVSKKLMAYGIEYKNLMYVMEGLTNLGAMSGDAAALDRIALALGQIQTTGYLAATEMRQLANAYVPIYDIVQEAFHLTGEQMQNVGDLRLPAHEVINAVVEYANAKFGSVGDAAMLTITGLKNRITDTVKVLGSEMTAPLTAAWKSFLKYVSDGLEVVRELYRQGGTGAIFEFLVPDPEKQKLIRTFFANLHNFIMSIMSVFSALKPVLSAFVDAFMIAFNAIAPIISFVINLLAAFIKGLAESTTGANALRGALVATAVGFLLFKAYALGAFIVTALTKAITKLSVALRILGMVVVKHPILMLLAALGIALAGVAGASDKARNALSNFFGDFSKYSGTVSDEDIFKTVNDGIDDAADKLSQFDNAFEGGEEAAEEMGDAVEGIGKDAKKAAAGLLSFDEVFKLNEKSDDSAGSGLSADIAGMLENLGGISSGLGEALIPEIPDFSSFVDEFTGDLFGGLSEKMMAIASGGSAGLLIGGLAGFAIGALVTKSMKGAMAGAQLGTKIGTVAGAAFGGIFTDAYNSMEEALQGIAVGGATGWIVGTLAGMFIGAFATKSIQGAMAGARIGGVIGSIVGGTFGGIFGSASEELKKTIEQLAVGSADGALAGGLAGLILGSFVTRTWQGALAGAKWGAMLGALIGGPVNQIFGEAETSVKGALDNIFSSVEAAGYGMLIGGLVGMIIGAIVGVFAGGVGAIPGARAGATLGAALGGLGGLLIDYLDGAGILDAMGNWFSDLGSNIAKWFSDAWTAVSDWFVQAGKDIADWCTQAWNDISGWCVQAGKDIGGWCVDTGTAIGDWCSQAWSDISGWCVQAGKDIGNWCSTAWSDISGWCIDAGTAIGDWCSQAWSDISGWCVQAGKDIGNWVSDTWGKFTGWVSDTGSAIKGWASNAWNDVSGWCVDTANKLGPWWEDTKAGFKDFANKTKENIIDGFNKADEKISDFIGLETSIGTFAKNALKSLKDFASGVWDSVSDKFGKAIEKLKEYIEWVKEAAKSAGQKIADSKVGQAVSNGWNAVTDFVGGLFGHASGGIFDREHIARFAEGNKAEAIIPLENARAMQPFVDAVSNGILGNLAPVIAAGSGGYGNANQLQPLYVGTLIADERGLKELYKKFEVIQIQENARRGI